MCGLWRPNPGPIHTAGGPGPGVARGMPQVCRLQPIPRRNLHLLRTRRQNLLQKGLCQVRSSCCSKYSGSVRICPGDMHDDFRGVVWYSQHLTTCDQEHREQPTAILSCWPLILKCDIKTHFIAWYLEHFLWNWSCHVNATECYRW